MAFINEFIPEEDYIKYRINELNEQEPARGASIQWTIDREADIWIREHDSGIDHTDPFRDRIATWDFYWKGTVMLLSVTRVNFHKDDNSHRYRTDKLVKFEVPKPLMNHRAELLNTFVKAMQAYNGGGVSSDKHGFDASKYHYTLEE